MTVIYVLAAIAAIFSFYYATMSINTIGIRQYGYAPINGGTIAFSLLPFSMLVAGMVGQNHGESYAMALGILFALLFAVGLLIWISKKTSWGIAAISTLMITIIGIGLIVLLFMIAAAKDSQCNHCDDYY